MQASNEGQVVGAMGAADSMLLHGRFLLGAGRSRHAMLAAVRAKANGLLCIAEHLLAWPHAQAEIQWGAECGRCRNARYAAPCHAGRVSARHQWAPARTACPRASLRRAAGIPARSACGPCHSQHNDSRADNGRSAVAQHQKQATACHTLSHTSFAWCGPILAHCVAAASWLPVAHAPSATTTTTRLAGPGWCMGSGGMPRTTGVWKWMSITLYVSIRCTPSPSSTTTAGGSMLLRRRPYMGRPHVRVGGVHIVYVQWCVC